MFDGTWLLARRRGEGLIKRHSVTKPKRASEHRDIGGRVWIINQLLSAVVDGNEHGWIAADVR